MADETELPPGIGSPATRAFTQIGLTRLHQFSGRTEQELLALHGVGPKAIRILKAAMAEEGLAFKAD